VAAAHPGLRREQALWVITDTEQAAGEPLAANEAVTEEPLTLVAILVLKLGELGVVLDPFRSDGDRSCYPRAPLQA
jgi:hypothetical protein